MAKTLVQEIYPISFALSAIKINRKRAEETMHEHNRGIFPQMLTADQRRVNALRLMTSYLDISKELGADYVWVAPLYHSQFKDGGYDISNHYAIDPIFGSMNDFDHFVETAHAKGIKVLMDMVLNHTSTAHDWFRYHPEYYCWSDTGRPGWRNLFDGGPAWSYDLWRQGYYLHLFHQSQADLNWFPGGELNQELIQQFRTIVGFWLTTHHVDGFRLDVPQAINKDFDSDTLELQDLIYGDQIGAERAMAVLNAVFGGPDAPKTHDGHKPFLVMECFDPSNKDLIMDYVQYTPVDYCLNALFKDATKAGRTALWSDIAEHSDVPGFMLDLESHDAPRVSSRLGDDSLPQMTIRRMFESGATAICLYQGQELGLRNPSQDELPDDLMARLDAVTDMRHAAGEDYDDLRPDSRANARVALPLEEYERQRRQPNSCFNCTKEAIRRWKFPL